MLIRIKGTDYEVPFASMDAMLARYDSMPSRTGDRKAFKRQTELIAVHQASLDMKSEESEGLPVDHYKPTRYKKCLRSVLRRRSNKRSRQG